MSLTAFRSLHRRLLAKGLGLLFVMVLLIGGLPGNAAQLTGKYTEDGLLLVNTLRTALTDSDSLGGLESSQAEAQQVIESFAGRYHGARFDKMASFTTLRTVSNTLASVYRSPGKRPLKPEQVTRVLTQLNRAEADLKRGS
ncbi:MAG: photosystem II protein Psb27 [Cyanobacteriota bacterium]|nr:photosystem II protein Psb27 [Cyanobacteriota bacterium]